MIYCLCLTLARFCVDSYIFTLYLIPIDKTSIPARSTKKHPRHAEENNFSETLAPLIRMPNITVSTSSIRPDTPSRVLESCIV